MQTNIILILGLLFFVAACTQSNTGEGETNEEPEQETDRISSAAFGQMPDGTTIESYTIRNANGLEMQVITYGGIITSLKIPDKEGNLADVVLGYDNLEGYIESNPYFGAIIGRYGNRIAGGQFNLDGTTYELAKNNGPNHLHGGEKGFDKVVWQAEPFEDSNAAGVRLSYRSPDMEEGYPGNLDVVVTYTLNDDDELIFDYEATTDKKTVVNLTNHSYYNLSGMEEDILGHVLEINADEYLPVDNTLIPLQAEFVEGTPFDFTNPTEIGSRINDENIQLEHGGGYDHCWILNKTNSEPGLAATLLHPESGRYMEIYTTEPGIQFYSGNFLDGSITGKNGVNYGFRSGLCLETQHYPDSPNRPEFPGVELNPGETYTSRTLTKFSTK
jgi:aldose 1-epimerase